MAENKSRYVLVCQQAFAFATVAAVGLSAAGVVELRIVAPGDANASTATRHVRAADTAMVSSGPVRSHVRTVPLGGAASEDMRLPQLQGRTDGRTGGATAQRGDRAVVTSLPEGASGFATVGVTWDAGQGFTEDDLRVSVRTLKHGRWSSWQPVHYDPEHEPDPGTESSDVRDGTDAVVVGDVDDVQVRAVSSTGRTPAGLALAIVDPGDDVAPQLEKPAIDTGTLASSARLAGTPAAVTRKPKIFSRAQWGADERLRDKPSLHYGEIHAGFVHHTVNANGYSRDEVPSILRGIYAYHTQSRGWSDVGYNFLVDRFGRIWEGRYGGVARPVVGAHTLGYNEDSFAMSAIGNFETVQPSQRMLDAYARLFAWKLSLSGVRADDTRQYVTSRYFEAINGHRDAGQTACPGRYLYAKIPAIRRAAAALQAPFAARNPQANLAGSAWPDLVVRDTKTQHAMIVRTGGQTFYLKGTTAATGLGAGALLATPGDVDEDGTADLVARGSDSDVHLYRGAGEGRLSAPDRSYARFSGLDLLTGVGDFDGDGHMDLVGRDAATDALLLYPGNGDGSFDAGRALLARAGGYDLVAGVDDLDGDGHPDLVARSGGTLYLLPGTGKGLRARIALPGDWSGFDVVTGRGDASGDGNPDLIGRVRASGRTWIYPGDGAGGLEPRLGPFTRFSGLSSFSLAGQLVSGKASDVAGLTRRGAVRVYPNSGRRNVARITDTGTSLRGIDLLLNVGDWNGDGRGDVMTRDASTRALSFRAGLSGGRLAAPVTVRKDWSGASLVSTVGDMTGDGFPDLVGKAGGSFRVYPSNGSDGFGKGYVIHSAFEANRLMAIGLWDNDGTPDLMTRRSDGSLVEWSSNGPGGLTTSTKVGTGANQYNWLKGYGDLNGDGLGDLVGRDKSDGNLYLIPRQGDGFAPRRLIAPGFDRYDMVG
jgi:hypothetical protein